uniref:C1q domain-containing protein n=1 Tax=Dicentrarchus labrax TaxID=13489 RepID=A0A8C4H6D6_DICLA
MRVVLGLLLLLLGLCGSGAQGEGGGLDEVGAVEESSEQTTKQTTPDIWAEVRALRDMVVELKVELRNMEARVKDSESQLNELKTELMVTKVQMELLQRENSVQATQLISLGTRLTATESKTSDLEKQNAALQTRLSTSESELLVTKSRIDQLERESEVQATQLISLETRLTATESKTSDLEKQNADLQTRLSTSESELLVTKSRIDQLERENAEKPRVAFYTALTNSGQVGPYNTDITLKYSKVFTNIGNAYNPATGFFTAPVKGVYNLQFTAFGHHAGSMGIQVYKNNQKVMHNGVWQPDGGFEYFTNSLVLELIAGDKIHLGLPSGHFLYDDGNNHSTFSGALLFPL